jgi:hypothetical protein
MGFTSGLKGLMKIRAVGAEFFHAGGRMDKGTDRNDEANIRFSQFCEHA